MLCSKIEKKHRQLLVFNQLDLAAALNALYDCQSRKLMMLPTETTEIQPDLAIPDS